MRKFLLVAIVLSSFRCFAQKTTQENNDSLYLKRQLYILMESGTSYRADGRSMFTTTNNGFINPNEFKLPDSYYLPLLAPYQKPGYLSRFLLDANLTNHIGINDNSSITTSHVQSNYIGLGGLNMITANYNFNIGDIGIFSPGIYAAKYNIYNNFLNDAGVNANLKILLSDRISVNLFGQYSNRESKISISPFISPLYPHSNYGGSVEFKVNDNWGLMMGAENEYDIFLRKWVTRPFIMPLFYK